MNKPIILVTGATSGIGRATCLLLAQKMSGCTIIAAGRREERLQELKQIIENETASHCITVCLDVRSLSDVEQKITRNSAFRLEDIDILINNAGLAAGLSTVDEGSIDHWERMIDTNVKGLLYVSKPVIAAMKKKRSGHIINLSSVAGKDAYTGAAVYCATKFGVEAITRSMRQELVPYGIKVSSIAPGAVNTEFSQVRFDGDKEKADKVYNGFDPLYAEDIAECILFILTAPEHVNIADMTILPKAQADSRMIHKEL
ncbi:MAG: SDR family NAD(P)-dependent oxidoreductase [Porphyromonas sp.]|nr:SDR family NAD(P)-dependent oxidoreductase [Porphyromonas sp.]